MHASPSSSSLASSVHLIRTSRFIAAFLPLMLLAFSMNLFALFVVFVYQWNYFTTTKKNSDTNRQERESKEYRVFSLFLVVIVVLQWQQQEEFSIESVRDRPQMTICAFVFACAFVSVHLIYCRLRAASCLTSCCCSFSCSCSCSSGEASYLVNLC